MGSSTTVRRIGSAIVLTAALFCQHAHGTETIIWTDGFSGSLPGNYSHITYTITTGAPISLTDVCDSATHDGDYAWSRDPDCTSPGVNPLPGSNYVNNITPTDWTSSIEFSQAVPISLLSTLIVDFNVTGSTDTITVISTDGATPADLIIAPKTDGSMGLSDLFDPTDSAMMTYTPATGVVSHTGYANARNRGDLHLIGNSTKTITKLTHTIQIGAMGGGTNGTILNYGFREAVAVPEPAPYWLLGSVAIGHILISRWSRGRNLFPGWLRREP